MMIGLIGIAGCLLCVSAIIFIHNILEARRS